MSLKVIYYNVLTEWENNPTITYIEMPDYPIENVNFPTITICPEENEFNPLGFITKLLDFTRFPTFYSE
jgi:hypothetical protein